MKYQEYSSRQSEPARDSSQIESDVQQIRNEIDETLRILEQKLSPLVDQYVSKAKAPSNLIRSVSQTVRDNPVPILLIATGAASLYASQRKGEPKGEKRGRFGEMTGRARHALSETKEHVTDEARHLKARAHEKYDEGAESASGTGSGIKGQLQERGHQWSEQARETRGEIQGTARDWSHKARERWPQARQTASRTIHEQPLVVMGLGLALGAMLGASLPMSQKERQVMGPKREQFKRAAHQKMTEGVERARERVSPERGEARDPAAGQSGEVRAVIQTGEDPGHVS